MPPKERKTGSKTGRSYTLFVDLAISQTERFLSIGIVDTRKQAMPRHGQGFQQDTSCPVESLRGELPATRSPAASILMPGMQMTKMMISSVQVAAYFDIFERTLIMESKNMMIPETTMTTYCVSKSVP